MVTGKRAIKKKKRLAKIFILKFSKIFLNMNDLSVLDLKAMTGAAKKRAIILKTASDIKAHINIKETKEKMEATIGPSSGISCKRSKKPNSIHRNTYINIIGMPT
jgi:hypothetical protein